MEGEKLLNIQDLRLNQKLTQDSIAKAVGISSRTYRRIETGKNEPRLSTALELEKFFGKDIKFLFEDVVGEAIG